LTRFSIFDKLFYFWQDFLFLIRFLISAKIFDFWQDFPFLTEYSILRKFPVPTNFSSVPTFGSFFLINPLIDRKSGINAHIAVKRILLLFDTNQLASYFKLTKLIYGNTWRLTRVSTEDNSKQKLELKIARFQKKSKKLNKTSKFTTDKN